MENTSKPLFNYIFIVIDTIRVNKMGMQFFGPPCVCRAETGLESLGKAPLQGGVKNSSHLLL